MPDDDEPNVNPIASHAMVMVHRSGSVCFVVHWRRDHGTTYPAESRHRLTVVVGWWHSIFFAVFR